MPSRADDPPRRKWNRRHTAALAAADSRPPSSWLIEHRRILEAQSMGGALDLACGLGRNSIFLAELGFRVEAVDISDVAVEWLVREAERRELTIDARRVDLEQGFEPLASYQVILMMSYLERPILGLLQNWLAPRGLLVVEAFVRGSGDDPAAGMNPAFVLEPDELLRAADGLTVVSYRAAVARPHEGGERWVASLVARRP